MKQTRIGRTKRARRASRVSGGVIAITKTPHAHARGSLLILLTPRAPILTPKRVVALARAEEAAEVTGQVADAEMRWADLRAGDDRHLVALGTDQRAVDGRAGVGDVAVDRQERALRETVAGEGHLLARADDVPDDMGCLDAVEANRRLPVHGKLSRDIDE